MTWPRGLHVFIIMEHFFKEHISPTAAKLLKHHYVQVGVRNDRRFRNDKKGLVGFHAER